jgi:large subunit ribosomal protein L29
MGSAGILREKSKEALVKVLDEARENLFRLRMQKAIGQLENTSQLKSTRRQIARILTVIAQKDEVHGN